MIDKMEGSFGQLGKFLRSAAPVVKHGLERHKSQPLEVTMISVRITQGTSVILRTCFFGEWTKLPAGCGKVHDTRLVEHFVGPIKNHGSDLRPSNEYDTTRSVEGFACLVRSYRNASQWVNGEADEKTWLIQSTPPHIACLSDPCDKPLQEPLAADQDGEDWRL